MLIELREKMAAALKELGDLQRKDERTADDESRVDALLAEVNDLGPRILREKNIEDATSKNAEYTQPAGQRVSGRVAMDENGAPAAAMEGRAVQGGSIARRFAKSDELTRYANAPSGTSGRWQVDGGSFFHRGDPKDLEERTLIWTAATSNIIPLDRQPSIYRPDLIPYQLSMRDVIPNYTTDSNSVEYVRELAFTNAAAGTAEAVSTVTGAKPESALTFEVVNTPVQTIAHWIPVTRAVLQDAGMLEGYINNRLLEGLKLVEDAQIVAGNGTAPNLRGLMATTGIGDLNAAYWTGAPLPATPAVANNLDRLRRAIKYIQVAGGAQPDFVVLHPDDSEKFDELKDSTGQYFGTGPFSYAPIKRLWGQLAVVENSNMTTGNFLVGRGAGAGIFDRMNAEIFVADQHSDFFIRNIFVILAEERLALAVFRPVEFAKGVFA